MFQLEFYKEENEKKEESFGNFRTQSIKSLSILWKYQTEKKKRESTFKAMLTETSQAWGEKWTHSPMRSKDPK